MKASKYDLKELEKRTIIQCFKDNSESTIKEIAILLNVAERTLYRLIKSYKLKEEGLFQNKEVRKMVEKLESLGYNINK